MKFFNIDCHVSVISDVKNIFEKFGHSVDHWSLSGHNWVFGFPPCPSPVINSSNWRGLNEEMVEVFYDTHKNELDKYDAFICGYPIAFLKLFERFNKPIIVISAIRYDHPFSNDSKKLLWLEDSLKNNNTIVRITNNEFDQKYCEKFLGNKWQWIPSLCDYTNTTHKPKQRKSVVFSKFPLTSDNTDMVHQVNLGEYSWEDLYSFESIVHFPYNVSTMSIFEQYQAGVPLSIPSLSFALELISKGMPLFSEIVFSSRDSSRSRQAFLNEEWLSYSDFYNGTIKCSYFDSLDSVKPNRSFGNESNKEFIYDKWESLLFNLSNLTLT